MLTLPITKKWFDMILVGEKLEEYREIKPYWRTRFQKAARLSRDFPGFDSVLTYLPLSLGEVKFRNGYGKDAPELIAECRLRIGTGKPEWGAAEGEEYYILSIEKLTWNSFTKRGGIYREKSNMV